MQGTSKKRIKILFAAIPVLFFQGAFAQKTFHVKIILSKSIDPQQLQCQYYDGKNDITIDTVHTRTFLLQGQFYSQLVALRLGYPKPITTFATFFIDDKSAVMQLSLSTNKQLKHTLLRNAEPISPTSNEELRDIDNHIEKDAAALSEFWAKHGSRIWRNDSLVHINNVLFKKLTQTALSTLKTYPPSFFSFWYFRNHLVIPSLDLFRKDTAYLKALLTYFTSTFPPEYTKSIEGIELIKQINGYIKPRTLQSTAPQFSATTVDSKEINLRGLRGKYVLLDFWATWCGPCMNEVPFIKKIRKEISSDKLVIIGISRDHNENMLKKVIAKKGMNWIQVWDREDEITHLYGVQGIPQLFLIDKKGIIVYKRTGFGGPNQDLLNILKGI